MTASDWTSLLPALVTIILTFATRQVVAALFAGIVTGAVVLATKTGAWADLNFVNRFFFPALGSEGFARILLIYLWCLGGLMGLWARTGGARHFARTASRRFARGPRSSLAFAWLLGVVFHQGGTVSTVLAATTARPATDGHRISHEELAYVVDSTASPVATVLPFNAWPGFVAALVAGSIPILPDASAAQVFFFDSIRFNFYALFAVAATLLFALGVLPAFGALARARQRARETGALDARTARPMLPEGAVPPPLEGYQPSLADFLVPLGVLLGTAVVPYLGWRADWINEAFLASVLSAMLVARVRGMPGSEVIDAFVDGCRAMTIGAIVLALAVTLGLVSKELDTAGYLTGLFAGSLPALWLPAVLTFVCMGIAFATGTSWGTYAVVFPVALPLAWALQPDPVYVQICFGAVLGGAVFGDQCSPISDTTILSSMFTGCDLMDHVRTQLPMALGAASLGVICSTLAVLLV